MSNSTRPCGTTCSGFQEGVGLPPGLPLADDLTGGAPCRCHDIAPGGNREGLVNRIIAKAPGRLDVFCYNAEYLFFPVLRNAHSRRTAGLPHRGTARRHAVLRGRLYAGRSGRMARRVSPGRRWIWTGRAITRWHAPTRQPTTPGNGSWISSAGCAGASRNMCPPTAARSTGSPVPRQTRADPAAGITPFPTRNTTPTPARGTTI